MKKIFTFAAVTAAVASAGIISALSGEAPTVLPVAPAGAAATDDETVIHAILDGSDDWVNESGDAVVKAGVYSTTFDPMAKFKACSATQTHLLADFGGFYADGYLYYLSGTVNSMTLSSTFHKMDVSTWREVASSGHTKPTLSVAVDMTYDYTTSTAYAVSPVYTGESNVFSGYALRTVDLESGEFTDVAPLQNKYTAIACDGEGQLWAIANSTAYPYAATLYRIDKTNGAETRVGDLGLNLKTTYSAAAFDLRTGKLYWSARTFTFNEFYEESYANALYEVNLADGSATVAKEYISNDLVSTLFFIDNNPKAPDAPSGIKFIPAAGSTTRGSMTATLPTTTYDGSPLTGKLSVEVIVDSETVATASGQNPGATYTTPAIDFAEGIHTVAMTVTGDNGLRSLKAETNVYSGFDTPAAVGSLATATNTRGNEVTVSWTAPTAGSNGGYVDPAAIRYEVVRRPDGLVVASDLAETSYTDHIDRDMGVTQYEVRASVNGAAGPSAYTKTIVAGAPHSVPYLETFDSNTAFMSFVTIDANNDAVEDGNYWMYYAATREAIWWMSYSAAHPVADDWMIAPAIDFQPGRVYTVEFDTHGYSSGVTPRTTFDVCIGREPDAASMKSVFRRTITSLQNIQTRIRGQFAATDEDAIRLGFHATNDGLDHITLDNIHVSDYGPASIAKAPEVASCVRNDDGNVEIALTLPTEQVDGKALSSIKALLVYGNNNRLAGRVDNPAKGQTLSVVDTKAANGLNSYVILVVTDEGEGMEAYTSIDILPGKPKAVTNLKAFSDDNSATLTWEYPSDMLDADGKKLLPRDLSYNIYVTRGSSNTVVAEGVTGTTYVDEDAVRRLGGARQGQLIYRVVAVTEGGVSLQTQTSVVVGEAFDLPYIQHFMPYDDMWTGSNFRVDVSGYDPMCRAGVDDTRFMSLYSSGSMAVTPLLDFSSLISPKLSFWVYKTSQSKYNKSTFSVAIQSTDGYGNTVTEGLPLQYQSIAADADGWVQIEVDLSDYSNVTRGSVCFIGYNNGGWIHLDDVEVTGTRAPNDIRIVSIQGPSKLVNGRDNVYTVTVNNNGTERAEGFEVSFAVDGEAAGTETGSLDAGESLDVTFTVAPAVNVPEQPVVLTATVAQKEEDYNETNNTRSLEVARTLPDLPYITTLRARRDANRVELTWDDAEEYPHSISVTDDFERYSNFIIDGIGSWKTIDGDGSPTISGISSSYGTYTWKNCGNPQAFILFNPTNIGVQSLATAHSGDRCLVSFASLSGSNDDWLISPQLLGGRQTISFWARAMHPSYLAETVEIAVSYSGNEVEDFEDTMTRIRVNSATWRRYTVDLPAGSRYFAFHCVSSEQFGLMLDDIEYIPVQPSVELWGYNVYRDGQRIAIEHPENSYTDTEGAPDQVYDYNVTAVYAEGESAFSNTVNTGRSEIDEVGSDTDGVIIAPVVGGVVVKGAEGLMLTVHTIDGKQIYGYRAAALETLSLEPGIYVVSAGRTTAKVSVR
ncbi:MAG: choice-of-anchor J domain-containing protein [Clostridium sp.]|nr:choice-of-anchor J domain-containing protein [Clostridium sp.]